MFSSNAEIYYLESYNTYKKSRKKKSIFFANRAVCLKRYLTGFCPFVHRVFLFKLCFTSYHKTICTVKIVKPETEIFALKI